MSAAAYLDSLAGGLRGRARRRGFADGVGQRLQIVCLSGLVNRLAEGETDHVPPTRSSHPVRMPGAQVIAMRLDERRERAEDSGRVAVDVRQRVQGHLLAGWPGALASGHRSTAPIWCWYPEDSSTDAPGVAGY